MHKELDALTHAKKKQQKFEKKGKNRKLKKIKRRKRAHIEMPMYAEIYMFAYVLYSSLSYVNIFPSLPLLGGG